MTLRRLSSAAVLLSISVASLAAEMGQTLVNTDLKSEPFADAKTLASLPGNSAVDVLKRQGGWMQVKPAGNSEGWVKMTAVKLGGATANAKGDSGMTALWNTAMQGRSGNTGVTVATGVRGLSPEDMKNAQPAPEQVKKLDSFAATKSQAESAAKSSKLSRRNIDYIVDASGARK
ncbi:hypothetical protein A7976_03625 [Methylobacillus sp. MM3]|jgi:hypothetical protein|uniref:SH3 domain-containing protein n=1 Tax=Methylobacillus sp. MM3 TaxID=1848039 RepID=UPI0007E0384D|nr:SH3 domain-containing protein [Methylobacillus sp. MM3]OAJ70682.1 hypothetical protein A7976_03625 [Methylobacillus sp. MM3]